MIFEEQTETRASITLINQHPNLNSTTYRAFFLSNFPVLFTALVFSPPPIEFSILQFLAHFLGFHLPIIGRFGGGLSVFISLRFLVRNIPCSGLLQDSRGLSKSIDEK